MHFSWKAPWVRMPVIFSRQCWLPSCFGICHPRYLILIVNLMRSWISKLLQTPVKIILLGLASGYVYGRLSRLYQLRCEEPSSGLWSGDLAYIEKEKNSYPTSASITLCFLAVDALWSAASSTYHDSATMMNCTLKWWSKIKPSSFKLLLSDSLF